MNALVIGQGGREHAIVLKLSQSPLIQNIHAIPGNDGFRELAQCHNTNWKDFNQVLNICNQLEIDFVFIGPEDPLCLGLSDFLRENNIVCIGPSAQAAQLEGSKIFAKEFMLRANIPTAKYSIVRSVEDVRKSMSEFTPPYVLKADGLAAGKGVFICKTTEELLLQATNLFEKKTLGEAGEQALLEQFMPGWELSYIFLTNGEDFAALPIAQDHKRLLDNNQGPNTGGMGTIAPIPLDSKLEQFIQKSIIANFLRQIRSENLFYRGVVFMGLMITESGPQVLEFNCRLGDPETQVLLPLIKNDFAELCFELAHGRLQPIRFSNQKSACVVIASPGYPDAAQKDVPINSLPSATSWDQYLLHAGTRKQDQQWLTAGGRVFNAVGIAENFKEALNKAYLQVDQIDLQGKQYRKDIGAQFL